MERVAIAGTEEPLSRFTIAIAATFTSEPIGLPLGSWLRRLDLPHTIKFAPYGQVFQSLVDPRSVLIRSDGGFNVLLIQLEDWQRDAPDQFQERSAEFTSAVASFASQSSSPTVICFCPDSGAALGLSANQARGGGTSDIQSEISHSLANSPGVYVVSSQELSQTYPNSDYFDKVTLRTAHMPYSRAGYSAMATMIARRLYALQRRASKVVVLDCDNTLWSGECAESGPQGVRIEEARRSFQRRLIDLRDRGMLLALCSKNNEQDVWDVFDNHEGMLLRREHITASEINWDAKSKNLARLARKIGLGTESFVFLDDQPIEVAEVQANCPAAVAMRVPPVDAITAWLPHVWAFDRLHVTDEDRKRAEAYRREVSRQESRQAAVSLRQFLADLKLRVQFQDLNEQHLERMAQLTQRTNQFNCSVVRKTSSELQDTLADPSKLAITVEVSDKFGDYGLVGFILGTRREGCLQIDGLLLSCRALGRGVEHHMLRHLGRLAIAWKLDEVSIRFVQGPRNLPAAAFLRNIGEEFGTPVPEGVLYRFPASRLEQIDPLAVDDAAPEQASTQPLLMAPESQPYRSASAVLNEIAEDYQTVEQIVAGLKKEAAPRPVLEEPYVATSSKLQRAVADICADVLHLDRVGINDSLSDLGGTSLQIVQIHSQIVQQLAADISITDLYSLPSVREIAERLQGESGPVDCRWSPPASSSETMSEGIAVVGMAGRFPGADDVEQLWQNLIGGVNCIVEIPPDELNLPATSPLRDQHNLVRKCATVSNADKFDAKFFGVFPREAQLMDPQHRLMLECCWHALEDAGYCPDTVQAPVGVFAGCYMDTYILASLASNPGLLTSLADSFHGGDLHTELGNDKDYLATRISYLLNLRGPSMTVQTACSSSLVAIIQASHALQTNQCGMALAGGATLRFPQKRGYLHTEGGMVSPDGVCRPFDAAARGTVFGDGVAAVVLKRMADAVADGDDIYAIIRGWGLNNDGNSKMAFTAPSVEGQAAAVHMAHQRAGIEADSISYVEAHGTGTSLGDPIEIDALTKAFRQTTAKQQYCAIGSVKSNIGHLDVAAGVTGLIKNCLAMRHELIPPSLNYRRANPNIDFAASPFYVVTEQQQWKRGSTPRRAGLSSFGVGGTNAHLVIEEPPLPRPAQPGSEHQLVVLSARSPEALDRMTNDLADHLQRVPDTNLADAAFTLQLGRKRFNYSRVLVARDSAEACRKLRSPADASVFTHHQVSRDVPVAFMFPGQGSQHANMAQGLYQCDSVFRTHFDECCEILRPHLGFDLKDKVFIHEEESAAELNQTLIAQPAVFSVSYSLAKCLEQLGIMPSEMVGHSVGEFVAGCLSGVFALPDALRLIAFRAKSMQQLPAGSMLAVRMTEADLQTRLTTDVEIAAVNGHALCVVAGPNKPIADLQRKLEAEQVVCLSLHTSHAFHTAAMDPVVKPFANQFKKVRLGEPTIPIVSSITGQVLSADQAADPMYWAKHLRETVRFTDALEHLVRRSESTLLEVGPGQTLSTLTRQHPGCTSQRVVLASLPHAQQSAASAEHWLLTLGRLWQAGSTIDWSALYQGQRRARLHLPTYPFERQRYWFDDLQTEGPTEEVAIRASDDVRQQPVASGAEPEDATLSQVFHDDSIHDTTELVIKQQLEIMKQQLAAWYR